MSISRHCYDPNYNRFFCVFTVDSVVVYLRTGCEREQLPGAGQDVSSDLPGETSSTYQHHCII